MLSKLNSVADRVLSALAPKREAGACGPVCTAVAILVSGQGACVLYDCYDPCHQVPHFMYCA